MKTVHAFIQGRVQGVWYRGWTQQTAIELGLNGWVRNRLDGSVEAVFQGSPEQVEKMLLACQHGPANAHVDLIKTGDYSEKVPTGFHRKSTL